MSVRMLQRALRTQELGNKNVEPQEEEESEQLRIVGNAFDLLGVPDESEGDEEHVTLSDNHKREEPLQNKRKKLKRKEKKKGKKPIVPSEELQTDDVDQILKCLSLNDMNDRVTSSSNPCRPSGVQPLEVLIVDTKHLRAEDELKRIFGSKVIKAVDRANEANSRGLARKQGTFRKHGRGNLLRRTTLVTPKEYWPYWDASFSMELIDQKDGFQYFRYTFSSSYMETQQKYEASGASFDPNTIAMLLAEHPYHLESLLALAEVYRQLQEYQQSVEYLERALFALECGWHSLFNPYNGTCRLSFSVETNKHFFFALSKHMQHLVRRGCHRSALEVCKVLLSLDVEDPLGALFSIDYFALRAEQFEWLEQFAQAYSSDGSLALLPNFSFSLAVAKFHLEARVKEASKASVKGEELSVDLLKQALMLHPAVLSVIMEKARIKEDSEWTKVLRHPHFKKATAGGPSLEHLIRLYVERNYLIWRVPALQAWLKTASLEVINAVDSDSGEAANWACVRQEAFSSQTNEYRHLHVSDFSDSAPNIPAEELQQIMFRGDVNILDDEAVEHHDERITGLQNRNAVLVFLQSLLPWTNMGQEQQHFLAPEAPERDEH